MSNNDTFDIQPTTSASFQVIDGSVVLVIHTIVTEGPERYSVTTMAFDVDAYALELANNLMSAVVEQKAMEGTV